MCQDLCGGRLCRTVCGEIPHGPALSRKSSGAQAVGAASLVAFFPLVHSPALGGAEDGENRPTRTGPASLPVIAAVARLSCCGPQLQNEYPRLENWTLREQVSGRIRLTDEERRSLAEAALAMDRRLVWEVVSIVRPERILAATTGAQAEGCNALLGRS